MHCDNLPVFLAKNPNEKKYLFSSVSAACAASMMLSTGACFYLSFIKFGVETQFLAFKSFKVLSPCVDTQYDFADIPLARKANFCVVLQLAELLW